MKDLQYSTLNSFIEGIKLGTVSFEELESEAQEKVIVGLDLSQIFSLIIPIFFDEKSTSRVNEELLSIIKFSAEKNTHREYEDNLFKADESTNLETEFIASIYKLLGSIKEYFNSLEQEKKENPDAMKCLNIAVGYIIKNVKNIRVEELNSVGIFPEFKTETAEIDSPTDVTQQTDDRVINLARSKPIGILSFGSKSMGKSLSPISPKSEGDERDIELKFKDLYSESQIPRSGNYVPCKNRLY